MLVAPSALHAQVISYAGAQSALTANLTAPVAVALDAAGNRYFVSHAGTSISEVSATGAQTTIAVAPVTISDPRAIAVDLEGNLYVADYGSTHIVKVPVGGGVSTSVGSGLSHPTGLTVDSAGNVYIADGGNQRVAKVAGTTLTSVSAGSFTDPVGLAFDPLGRLYVSDIGKQQVFKITFAGSQTTVTTSVSTLTNLPYDVAVNQAGDITLSGGTDHAVTTYGVDGAIRQIGTSLTQPEGIAIDGSGNVYVADQGASAVDVIAPGSFSLGQANICPSGGSQIAPCTQSATLNFNIASGASLTGVTALVLTQGAQSLDFTPAAADTCTGATTGPVSCLITVTFTPLAPGVRLGAVEIDGAIAPATTPGVLAVVPLEGIGSGALAGFDAGTLTALPLTLSSATTPFLGSVIADSSGNLYFTDAGSCVVEKFVAATGKTTVVAGTGICGDESGDGGPATSATFKDPWRLALSGRGDLYIADDLAGTIRKVDGATGVVTVFAGVAGTHAHSADGAVAASAALNFPYALALDGAGDLYFADYGDQTVRKIDATSGVLTTVAGNANQGGGFAGDGGLATSAQLNNPIGIALDSNGNLFIADDKNYVVREVTLSSGIINTFAGTPGTAGYAGDGAAATSAQLNHPQGVAVDAAGNVYIADTSNDVVRKVSASSGLISTVAGVYTGAKQNSGSGGSAIQAGLGNVQDVAVDSSANFYIVDNDNNLIDQVTPATGVVNYSGTFTMGTAAPAIDVAVTNNGNLPLDLSALLVTPNFNLGGADTSCTTSTTLAAGASCILGVDFLPTTGGPLIGTLTVTDDAANNPASTQTLALTGTGAYIATQLALAGVPATVNAGGNLGSIQVSVESSGGNLVTGSTASVTVTITGPGSYSQAVTATAAGGIATVNLSSLALSTAGAYTVTATSNGLTAAIAPVAALDFTVALGTGGSSSQTITAGATATYTFSIAPASGSFTSAVALTATGLPTGATYTFSPASVTPGSAATTSTLTIQTTASNAAVRHPAGFAGGLGGIALGVLLLPLAASRRMRRVAGRMPMLSALFALLSLGAVCGLTGCSGSGSTTSSGPTSHTYTVPVTGTSGSLVHTATVTLIVQ